MGNMKASSHRLLDRGARIASPYPNSSKSHCRCETLLKIPLPFHDLFLRSLKRPKNVSLPTQQRLRAKGNHLRAKSPGQLVQLLVIIRLFRRLLQGNCPLLLLVLNHFLVGRGEMLVLQVDFSGILE